MNNLSEIYARVEDKKRDYGKYDFSTKQDNALKTFFDLGQEFESLKDLYAICVAVPKAYFGLHINLYLRDRKRDVLVLVCTSDKGYLGSPENLGPADLELPEEAFIKNNSLFVPILGKMVPSEVEIPAKQQEILGVLEVSPGGNLREDERFYFQKFANRIGYALYNRMLSEKNIEHLKFINSLVADIEHNVIVPNMAFRLFLKRLQAKIQKNREIEAVLREKCKELGEAGIVDYLWQDQLMAELQEVNRGLEEEFTNIENHNHTISLFVESLFRRSHFQEGRFIPQKRVCNFRREIIERQLERFKERFQKRGIDIDEKLGGVPDADFSGIRQCFFQCPEVRSARAR